MQDPHLPAPEKIQRFFDAAARWKTAQKAYILALLHVWYADQDVIVRQKMQTALIKQAAPMLTGIIRQGIREGVLNTPFPNRLAKLPCSFTLVRVLGAPKGSLQLFDPETLKEWVVSPSDNTQVLSVARVKGIRM